MIAVNHHTPTVEPWAGRIVPPGRLSTPLFEAESATANQDCSGYSCHISSLVEDVLRHWKQCNGQTIVAGSGGAKKTFEHLTMIASVLLRRSAHTLLVGCTTVRCHAGRLCTQAQISCPGAYRNVGTQSGDRLCASRRVPVQHQRHRCALYETLLSFRLLIFR